MENSPGTLSNEGISINRAALIGGLGLLVMVLTVPFAEFQIFPDLFNYRDPAETAQNILEKKQLFSVGIFLNFITILCDIVVAWALYIFFKPVNQSLSLLAAWLRLMYTTIYLMALLNLIKVFSLLKSGTYFAANSPEQAFDLILFHIRTFGTEWEFGLILFGIFLLVLGYLCVKASYVPSWVGWAVIISGAGYLVIHAGKFLYPSVDTDFLMFTFVGELILMGWLLVKGSRLNLQETGENVLSS